MSEISQSAPHCRFALLLFKLFAGLLPLSEVCRSFDIPLATSFYSEINPDALHVALVNFSKTIPLGGISKLEE